jgi:AcrR family transcriptional regulator
VSAIEQQPGIRWRRRKTDRPAEILSAALASFAEHGFAATRLDDVAARAGVTKGTLYLYFDSKEELFKAVVRQQMVPNLERAEAMVAGSAASSLDLLERLVRTFAREVIGSPIGAIPKLVLTEVGNFPDLARFYREAVVDRGKALLRKVIERGVAAGELRPVDVENTVTCIVAPLLLAALWRHSFEHHAGPALDLDALCRAELDLLRRGLMSVPNVACRPRKDVDEPR